MAVNPTLANTAEGLEVADIYALTILEDAGLELVSIEVTGGGRLARRRFVQKYPDSSNLGAGRNATARRFIQTLPDWSLCRARELNGCAGVVKSVKGSFWMLAQ